jgi:hypothetical protein
MSYSAFMVRPDENFVAELVEQIVAHVLVKLDDAKRIPDRMAFLEEEAADLLGLQPHQLRLERRLGRIPFSRILGRRVRYQRADLVHYLVSRRTEATA